MKENQQKVYNFFKEKGLNDTAIAGIMGNLEQESGFTNPTASREECGNILL